MEELDGISAVNRLLNHSFPVPPSLGPRYFYWSAASLHTREWSSNHSRQPRKKNGLRMDDSNYFPPDSRCALTLKGAIGCTESGGLASTHTLLVKLQAFESLLSWASLQKLPYLCLSAWFCSPSQTPVGLPMIKFLGKVYVGKPCCCHTVPVCNLGLRHHGI